MAIEQFRSMIFVCSGEIVAPAANHAAAGLEALRIGGIAGKKVLDGSGTVCLPYSDLGTMDAAQKPTLRPAPSHGSSSTPPEEPYAH